MVDEYIMKINANQQMYFQLRANISYMNSNNVKCGNQTSPL